MYSYFKFAGKYYLQNNRKDTKHLVVLALNEYANFKVIIYIFFNIYPFISFSLHLISLMLCKQSNAFILCHIASNCSSFCVRLVTNADISNSNQRDSAEEAMESGRTKIFLISTCEP